MREKAKEEILLESFVATRDEAAFEALMRLHGPMVLGVCTRVLRNHHDAEEAFQATFLILSRKATSIMPRNHVGSWLYGVAYRTALKAKSLKHRRNARELQGLNIPEPEIKTPDQWNEIAPLLDRFVNSLPEKYRVPVVLCDLEGKSCKEVARELNCPEGTISSRLTRARSLLASRLRRQGVTLSVGALAVTLSNNAASAAVPSGLMAPVLQVIQLPASQSSVASGLISGNVVKIVDSVVKSMFFATLRQITAVMCLAAILMVSAIQFLQHPEAKQAKTRSPDATTGAVQMTLTDETTYRFIGTVIDSQGEPAKGAKIWMHYWRMDTAPISSTPLAVTDERGEFRFHYKASDFSDAGDPQEKCYAYVIASKEGHGPAAGFAVCFETTGQLISALPTERRTKLESLRTESSNVLRLVADDIPVRGRLLDHTGQPVAGARVDTISIYASVDGTLANWVAQAQRSDANWYSLRPLLHHQSGGHVNANDVRTVPEVTTDSDGYFTLRGIGRDRLAEIVVRGPDIETVVLNVRTRPGEIIKLARDGDPNVGYDIHYPNEFTHKLGPSVPVEGSVTDIRTGRPLANVLVRADRIASYPIGGSVQAKVIHTESDAMGHYRLEGLPMGENRIELIPPPGSECKDLFYKVKTMPNQEPIVEVSTATPISQEMIQTGQGSPNGPVPGATTESIGFLRAFIIGHLVILAAIAFFVVARRRRSRSVDPVTVSPDMAGKKA